jgi:hypothetical protein
VFKGASYRGSHRGRGRFGVQGNDVNIVVGQGEHALAVGTDLAIRSGQQLRVGIVGLGIDVSGRMPGKE